MLNPAAQQLNLPRRELSSRLGGRHAVVGIARGDAPDEFALRRIAGDDGEVIVELRLRAGFEVEAEAGLALGLVRAVALEAGVGKDGPDVAVELDRPRERLLRARHRKPAGENERGQKAIDPAKVHHEFKAQSKSVQR